MLLDTSCRHRSNRAVGSSATRTVLTLVIGSISLCSRAVTATQHADVPKALVRLREVGGFDPRGILDVGAHKASWSAEAAAVFPRAEFLLLEGDADLAPDLAESGRPFEIAVVGARDGPVTWHQHSFWKLGNSIYLENTNEFAPGNAKVQAITKQMRTVDTILAERGNNVTYTMLKCDVQGAELDVIRGAKKTLETVEVVILEVSLISYNDGAPRASRVVAAMYMRGFDLLDIVEQHHWNVVGGQQVLGQVDLMFAKKDSNLFDAYGRAMNLRVGKKKRSASKSRRAGLLL